MPTLQIISASTSGHTDYVIAEIVNALKKHPTIVPQVMRAESARAEDLLKGDALLLASGTWNTGGMEGQLNPHMDSFLRERAAEVDLRNKPVAIVALGDERYFYTGRAGEHLRTFIQSHGGSVLEPVLMVINEPYGQEERVRKWAEKFIQQISSVHT